MIENVSSRHEGDLGGLFLPFGDISQVGVTVTVAPRTAELPCVQHTAWMLVNLLSRFAGIIHRIGFSCPASVPLAGRIIPLAPSDVDLRAAVLAGASAIGVIPVEPDLKLERTIVVGTDDVETIRGDLYVYGNKWCGGISVLPITSSQLGSSSTLPFGPYVAACLAAGEIFKAARMRADQYSAPSSVFFSLWDYCASEGPINRGPSELSVDVDAALAGVGAVGCAFIHSLWATSGITGKVVISDNDKEGLDGTNLNRYVLFGRNSVDKAKASEAAEIASGGEVSWVARNEEFETMKSIPQRVVSAVDRNTSRAAIQNRYPARILSGSTLDLRAEVLRCGPPGIGACLRCFNPPEHRPSDEDLRAKLSNLDDTRLGEIASTAGITKGEAKQWIVSGKCGLPGERLLRHLQVADGEHLFAVGFVSAMAGIMLAAEFMKDCIGAEVPLTASVQRAVFQFHDPLARSNRASTYARDSNCPMCNPVTIACQKWAERYTQLLLQR